MAAYNAESYIGDAIASVIKQTCDSWELLCIDDGSSDSTAQIVAEAASEDDRIRLIRLPENRGQPTALNAGLAEALGDFVAILDADDVAVEDRLERSLTAFEADPALGLVGSGKHIIDAEGRIIARDHAESMDDSATRQRLFSEGNALVHSSVMVRRELLETVGGYDPIMLTSQDYDLYLRLAAHCKMIRIAPPLVKWRAHSGQKSVHSVARQKLFADFARRRAIAAAEGRAFDEEHELQALEREVSRSWHWMPRAAKQAYRQGRQHLRHNSALEARAAFKAAMRLCPGLA